MNLFGDTYRGRKVLVTGHTGFKGSWLSMWLGRLGAQVTGFSLDVPTVPSLFDLAGVARDVDSRTGDIRDAGSVRALVDDVRPDFIFHLAAQPLVRRSHMEPSLTVDTNVMGTLNLLEALRLAGRPLVMVAATSDKCYLNDGRLTGYRETDPLGGHDPYSMSKAAAELVIESWRASYFSGLESPIRLASGRAGNVLGGGDWGQGRIVTECIAALAEGRPIRLRNPNHTRPWQHVLEPLSGYLSLGAGLRAGKPVAEGWNFGPGDSTARTVAELAEAFIADWGRGDWTPIVDTDGPKEAATLSLNAGKARQRLDWRPVWDFTRCVRETGAWYRVWLGSNNNLRRISEQQMERYEMDGLAAGVGWARP